MDNSYTKGEYRAPMVKIVAVSPLCTICDASTDGLEMYRLGSFDE